MALLRSRRSSVVGRRALPVGLRNVCRVPALALLAAVTGLALSTAARAESFLLHDGREIAGEVIQGFSHSIMVKSAGGTLVPLALDSIRLVRIDLADNTQIVGQLLSWQNDVFLVGLRDRLIQVADGKVAELEELPPAFEEALSWSVLK